MTDGEINILNELHQLQKQVQQLRDLIKELECKVLESLDRG